MGQHGSQGSFDFKSSTLFNPQLKQTERNRFVLNYRRTFHLVNGTRYRDYTFGRLTLEDGRSLALLQPTISCPAMLVKMPRTAGGKWMCLTSDVLSRTCTIVSAGSRDDTGFEEGIRFYNLFCSIFIFDPFNPPSQTKWKKYHIREKGIGNPNHQLCNNIKCVYPYSLREALRREGQDTLTTLKLDIEGEEWNIIKQTPWCKLNSNQVLMEFHDKNLVLSIRSIVVNIFWPLEPCNFHLFALEPVPSGHKGQFEMAFLRLT